MLDSILWGMANPRFDWQSIIADEIRRHPSMTPDDLHKLVVQSVHGGNHLLRDAEQFRKGLATEWERLATLGGAADALQIIDPNGRTARLHLAPCKAVGCALDSLAALLLSQPLKLAEPHALTAAWSMIRELAGQGLIPFSATALQLSPDRKIGHHSSTYGPAAYRIVHDLRSSKTQEALCRLGLLV